MSIKESTTSLDNCVSSGQETEPKFIPITFWYHLIEGGVLKRNQECSEYEPNLKCIGSCDNITDFWKIFQHIKKPSGSSSNYDYQVFKKDIKPMWEEPLNKKGGKLSLYVNKDYTAFLWEEMVFAFAGGIMPYIEEINGITISSRKNFNVIQIWFRSYKKELVYPMRDTLKDFFQIPLECNFPSKSFDQSTTEITV